MGELVYGAERSQRPSKSLLELDTLLASIAIVAYDDAAAHRFGALKLDLECRSERLDDADLQIAATALSCDVPLVTHNGRHFGRVPGLGLEDWLL